MRALLKSRPEAGLWMTSVAEPCIDADEVLIKVRKTGICGTDVHIVNWDAWAQRNLRTPRIIGHEFVGEIVELGAAVKGFTRGDRVTAEGHVACGRCRNCLTGKRHLCVKAEGIGGAREGAFAEYIAVPAANLWPVPADIPDETAAILDPLGNAVHCALSFDVTGEDVLITGAGPIGIMAAAVCRHIGAAKILISDINDYRLQLAAHLHVAETVDVRREALTQAMDRLAIREGFGVGLEMSGDPEAFRQMIEVLYHGAPAALLGFLPPHTHIDWDRIIFKGLHLKGVYGREVFNTWYKMTQMLENGLDISGVITHRFPAEAHAEAFALINEGACAKVILEWDSHT